ncbi:MAG: DUF6152 family protein [Pseudomonadales bacterium]|nr:DUF6152 family protein [Pseudomonadales bacterium]
MMRLLLGFLLLNLTLPALAHHSFAVHFDADRMIEIQGVVTRFHFANPHGVIFLTVTGENGSETLWRGETNSPNLLKRRGWTADSIKPGQAITISGWPAREGEPMLRVAAVTFADGSKLAGQGSSGMPEADTD